jgi:heterodisulfide reductase subunit C
MANEMNPFLVEVLNTPGGAEVLQCYQCGTCAGSCPVLDEMEYGPRRIMHMIQAGMKEEVLTAHDMWFCVSCYSCANRCPRGIEITDLMAALRNMALTQGYADDKEAEFGQAFADTVKTHGRMFEPELMLRYYLRTWDILGLLSMVPLGIQMLLKGKLPFLPERVRNPQEVRALAGTAPNPPPRRRAADEGARSKAWRPWLVGAATALLGAVISGALWLSGDREGRG